MAGGLPIRRMGILYRSGLARVPQFHAWCTVTSVTPGSHAGDCVLNFASGGKVVANAFIPNTFELLDLAVAKQVPGADECLKQAELDMGLDNRRARSGGA
jgi:hypothetical protein